MTRPSPHGRLRRRRRGWRRPELTVLQILSWADAYYQKAGDWPQSVSGQIPRNYVEGR